MTDPKPDAATLLLEIREELFRLGQDSYCAYEHGDLVSMREADRTAMKIHARIDAFLAAPPADSVSVSTQLIIYLNKYDANENVSSDYKRGVRDTCTAVKAMLLAASKPGEGAT